MFISHPYAFFNFINAEKNELNATVDLSKRTVCNDIMSQYYARFYTHGSGFFFKCAVILLTHFFLHFPYTAYHLVTVHQFVFCFQVSNKRIKYLIDSINIGLNFTVVHACTCSTSVTKEFAVLIQVQCI